ncbi:hypothetical protein D3C81_928630 [compost metagenome]
MPLVSDTPVPSTPKISSATNVVIRNSSTSSRITDTSLVRTIWFRRAMIWNTLAPDQAAGPASGSIT